MKTAIIFDCEFLVTQDAQRRYWCGPYDPDPVIAQIGAVKLSLDGTYDVVDTFKSYVKPVDRFGDPYNIAPFFTKLTGISQQHIDSEGVTLAQSTADLRDFAGDAKLWSWGKDELNLMAISCYIAGIPPVLPANRFDNACKLMLAAGMPYDDVKRTRSNTLADYFDLEFPQLKGHDALDDALSVAYVVQYLLRDNRLSHDNFN